MVIQSAFKMVNNFYLFPDASKFPAKGENGAVYVSEWTQNIYTYLDGMYILLEAEKNNCQEIPGVPVQIPSDPFKIVFKKTHRNKKASSL